LTTGDAQKLASPPLLGKERQKERMQTSPLKQKKPCSIFLKGPSREGTITTLTGDTIREDKATERRTTNREKRDCNF